jgi:phosphoglycerate dehydrogenase-like enzyme
VQENEPVDSSNPFLRLENVVVTPHIGGNTEETVERQSKMIVEDLFRFLDGEKPLHLLNPEAYRGRD